MSHLNPNETLPQSLGHIRVLVFKNFTVFAIGEVKVQAQSPGGVKVCTFMNKSIKISRDNYSLLFLPSSSNPMKRRNFYF